MAYDSTRKTRFENLLFFYALANRALFVSFHTDEKGRGEGGSSVKGFGIVVSLGDVRTGISAL